MRTKRSYAEQVLRLLQPRLKPETKINIREVESALSIVRDQVSTIYLNQAVWANELGIFGDFISNYTIEVKSDSERGLTYATLPVRPLDIAKNYGIYQVFSAKDMGELFIPLSNSFNFFYNNDFSSQMEGLSGYIYEGENIYFQPAQEEGQTLQLNIVATSDDLDSFDNFPVAPSSVNDIIRGTVELITIEKGLGEDIINDEIDQA